MFLKSTYKPYLVIGQTSMNTYLIVSLFISCHMPSLVTRQNLHYCCFKDARTSARGRGAASTIPVIVWTAGQAKIVTWEHVAVVSMATVMQDSVGVTLAGTRKIVHTKPRARKWVLLKTLPSNRP